MSSESVRLVQRYVTGQRVIHWAGVVTFLLLLATGLVLLVPGLSSLAAGGVSRLVHRIAVAPFVLLPILYGLFNPQRARELIVESFTYTRQDVAWFKRMPGYFFGSTKDLPPQGRINAGQKLHHAGTFIMFVTVTVSGFMLWFGKGQLGPDGLGLAAIAHDVSMLGLTVLLIGHVYFTFVYDALSAMLTGWVTEEYARLEHPQWLAELPESAIVVK
ncbi:MAG: cytochrome b/b6 domain-containing protein [Chloroflexi bacterium]|nr:cytochrome b/b6 domain-containing protein [Chloroflexota bacterium]